MEAEKVKMRFAFENEESIVEEMVLYEEAPHDPEMVMIETVINGHRFSIKGDNYFSALVSLRKKLELIGVQIECNGAAKNVYPSSMQLSMGTGRSAYKMRQGEQARIADVVDIFERDGELEFVQVDEQYQNFLDWLKSLKR